MSNGNHCPVCRVPATTEPKTGHFLKWNCPRCGKYILADSAEAELRGTPFSTPAAVSGWIRWQNFQGVTPNIRSEYLASLRTRSKPSFRERAERYLMTVIANLPSLNAHFEPTAQELIGVSFCDDDREVGVIIRYLEDKKLTFKSGSHRTHVSPEGHIAADELRSRRAASMQGFVAMWFDPQMDTARDEGFAPAILAAGYSPMIISQKEHVSKVDDEIIAEIRRSAFLVADFTGHRGGVYFEAGYAMGRNLPVIWTCRKDHMKEMHFDIRQYNCIDWTDIPELNKRLQNRIEALLGKGPVVQR